MKTTLRIISFIVLVVGIIIAIQIPGMLTLAGLGVINNPSWPGEVPLGKAVVTLSALLTLGLTIIMVGGLHALREERRQHQEAALRQREPAPGTFYTEEEYPHLRGRTSFRG